MKTSIIIHGHFYQPPRENPETGLLPKQIERSRYSDWNQAITENCYHANCHSRYLGPYGEIKSIVNNYDHISWNFGPTLLRWFDNEDPSVIRYLQDADRHAIRETGHGNGIAQGFGHSILPLDSPSNRKIQIAWGIEDFKSRFARMPEGFWCPECAINPETIDDLCDAGIKFVILSPWQAFSIEDNGKQKALGSNPAPCDEPFWIKGTNGKLAAFFYDPELASGVSFGHLLRDADQFYHLLVQRRNEATTTPRLMHYATDGEIYGHHEPFGNMALTALIKKIKDGEDFELTNYGAYLEKHPPVRTAVLKKGDDNLGTSWSCCHGVGRWFRDCGCSTGSQQGWNQKWRTPLRNAFNRLGNRLSDVFEKEVHKMLPDSPPGFSHVILRDYYKVLTKRIDIDQYLASLSIDQSDRVTMARLLCGMKNCLYSFTSCGWFFNDLSGIEPRQNINYALFAIKQFWEFLSPSDLDMFLSDLSKAESNIKTQGNGKQIAISLCNAIEGTSEAVIAAYLNHLIDSRQMLRRYGYFEIEASGDFSEYLLTNSSTLEKRAFHIMLDSDERTLTLTNLSPGKAFDILKDNSLRKSVDEKKYSFSSIPERLKSLLLMRIDDSVCIHEKNLVREIGHSIEMLGLIAQSTGTTEPDIDYALPFRALRQFFNTDMDTIISEWTDNKLFIARIMTQISSYAPTRTKQLLNDLLSGCINRLAALLFKESYSERRMNFSYDLLRTARKCKIEPDITYMQDALYPYMMDKRHDFPLMRNMLTDLNFSTQG